jgi:integral membrane protein
MPSSLQTLRIIGFLEGLSFLLLLGYAMPLKYLWGEPAAVQQIGMAHGVLWMLYVGMAAYLQWQGFWKMRTTALLLLASLLPAGPFVADLKVLRGLRA